MDKIILPKPAFSFLLLFRSILVLSFLLIFSEVSFANEPYSVTIIGAPNEEIDTQLKNVSQLILLEERPPATLTGLRRRADNDLPDLIKVLNSHGYFAAQGKITFHGEKNPLEVRVELTAGKIFTLTNVRLSGVDDASKEVLLEIEQEDLPFPYNDIALPAKIIEVEAKLIELLADKGYPFASIAKRESIANYSKASLSLVYQISSGPKAFFGETTIEGNTSVKEDFIRQKIAWKQDALFSKKSIAKTQRALEALALFVTVDVTYPENVEADGSLPMKITVVEGKMRTVSAGISYMNDPGFKASSLWERFGINAAWQHRNMRGRGEKLSLATTLGRRYYYGTAMYIMPSFFRAKEDLIYEIEANHDTTSGYTESFLAVSATLDRKISKSLRFSYGVMFKRLLSTHSENHGRFTLFKVPLQVNWSSAADLLDPVRGHAVAYRLVPSYQICAPNFTYWINSLAYSYYIPIFLPEEKLVFAIKTTFGTLLGAKRRVIPAPERFYAGSDSVLRGYRYRTVSPLGHDRRPIGGLSMLVLSSELRYRPKDQLGYVLFYEVGNVYSTILPKLNGHQMHSAGLGLRYPTPVGPIRADLAFPLKRRKKIDSAFQLYFSIGQTF